MRLTVRAGVPGSTTLAALLAVVALLATAACQKELPEPESRAARLYREHCGSCHRAYHPSTLKYPMWEMIFPRMEGLMAEAGRPRLTRDQRRLLLDWLQRHAA